MDRATLRRVHRCSRVTHFHALDPRYAYLCREDASGEGDCHSDAKYPGECCKVRRPASVGLSMNMMCRHAQVLSDFADEQREIGELFVDEDCPLTDTTMRLLEELHYAGSPVPCGACRGCDPYGRGGTR